MRVCAALAVMLLSLAVSASADIITVTPYDASPPVNVSSAFGPLAAGGAVGSTLAPFGIDFTYGGVEGIFSDPPLAFGGVNGGGVIDLLAPVDARFVVGAAQGATSYVSVEGGYADVGNLLLEVYDTNGNLLASTFNDDGTGPNGRTLMTIDRAGVYDIAWFRVSTPGQDAFGVNQISFERVQSVPEPSLLALSGLGAIVVAFRRRRKAA